VAEETVEDVRNAEDGNLTAGRQPAGWWTTPADVAMRNGAPWEALFGAGESQGFPAYEGQFAGCCPLKEAESSREDEAARASAP
jgi:hypothetical protein